MSPHTQETKKQAPATLKNQWKEREKTKNKKKKAGTRHTEKSVERKRKNKKQKKGKGGGGGELDDDCSQPRWLKELHTLPDLRHTSKTPHYCACASKLTSDSG